ncbi:hypothetical protein BDF14DRAFT_1749558 [Spinellus fusiger]|nr:hypothetical protein BDF14DRAFT_1749558 [Spinellus fusiger]
MLTSLPCKKHTLPHFPYNHNLTHSFVLIPLSLDIQLWHCITHPTSHIETYSYF